MTQSIIYDTELEDVDATSKAIIQDIFIEVQEYTKTLPEGYIPFETFLDVVDQQYKETKITELVLLKNKLLKYRDLNVFAETLKDVLNLSIAIEKSNLTVIDISDMPDSLQKEIMSYTYGIMNSINSDIYAFTKINNSNTDKKLLKKFLTRSNVYTTLICQHEYKYLPEIKEVAQNLILFAPLTLQHDFASYNTFLNKLNQDEFIIYGAHTQNIPLIVELDEIEIEKKEEKNNTQEEITENVIPMPPIKENKEEETNKGEVIEEKQTEINNQNNFTQMPEVEYPDIKIDEIPLEQNNNTTEDTEIISINENTIQPVDNILSENQTEEIIEEDTAVKEKEEITNNIQENIIIDETIEPLEIETEGPTIQEENLETYNNSENDINDIEEVEIEPQIELQEPEIDYSVEDVDIEENFGEPQIIETNDELVEQVAKDVDKIFYEKLPDENYEIKDNENIETDELTEDDLNLIDDLTIDDTNIQLEEFQDINNIQQTPVVPIYETEDMEPKENQKLEPGDRVSTPKYGEGIVEKMIKYGNKMLCSIEFPNIGRRLLDPAMSEITKLD